MPTTFFGPKMGDGTLNSDLEKTNLNYYSEFRLIAPHSTHHDEKDKNINVSMISGRIVFEINAKRGQNGPRAVY